MSEEAGIRIFCACLSVGAAGGIFYDVLYPLKLFIKKRANKFIPVFDALFCVLFAGIYIFASVWLAFPDFRGYMFFGCMLGFLLYLKSFHRILDFLFKMLYNRIKNRGNAG